ncbi:MAG: GNAT family N-acetyltransferase [Flavobacteriales bacterium CG_4_9_14_3_um_filter_32_8]|nr:MAG: GNAT family N-acetyltransferase [Flavobacteriales bacterium CG_4_9_14_3_um_filter_32_8]
MEKVTWKTKAFKDLTVDEFFEIIRLRTAIFVVEQNCPYQEVDEKDRKSFHIFGKTPTGQIIAVSRILPQGVSYKEVSIGRVALKKEFRGKGIADEMMKESFQFIENYFGKQAIRISAQQYLLNFYNKHGFTQVGEMYLEDNIPHVEMLAQ